jgi:hypothetical protein
MKKIMQQVALLSALSCWIVVGISAKHNRHLACRQEWKAGLVNTAVDDDKELALKEACECGDADACLKAEAFLPGRAMQFLLQ